MDGSWQRHGKWLGYWFIAWKPQVLSLVAIFFLSFSLVFCPDSFIHMDCQQNITCQNLKFCNNLLEAV